MEIFETRLFFEKMLALTQYLDKEHKSDPNKYFRKSEIEYLAYPFYDEIVILLSDSRKLFDKQYLNRIYPDSISSVMEDLTPVIQLCKAKISDYDKKEADRNLSNKEKVENILYGRKGYRLSKIAIRLSVTAILVEISRVILDLLL